MPIPKVIKSGKIQLGNQEIEVHILDNGKRVVTEEGIENFMKFLTEGNASEKDIKEFAKVIKGYGEV